MPFKTGRLSKKNLEDLRKVQASISSFNFNQSFKKERDFEFALGNALAFRRFHQPLFTQTDNRASVESAVCFGKRHRPDLTIGRDYIALELKYLRTSTSGFREAIGQAYLYRLHYRFVVVVLVLGPELRAVYERIAGGEDDDVRDLFGSLAQNMKIFTYIAPAFRTSPKSTPVRFHRLKAD